MRLDMARKPHCISLFNLFFPSIFSLLFRQFYNASLLLLPHDADSIGTTGHAAISKGGIARRTARHTDGARRLPQRPVHYVYGTLSVCVCLCMCVRVNLRVLVFILCISFLSCTPDQLTNCIPSTFIFYPCRCWRRYGRCGIGFSRYIPTPNPR